MKAPSSDMAGDGVFNILIFEIKRKISPGMPERDSYRVITLFCKNSELLLDLGAFADSVAKVVELCASYFTDSYDLDLVNVRGMYREGLLDADAVRNASDSEGLGDAAAILCDNGSLEDLNTLTRTLFDLVVNTDGVTDIDHRDIFLELLIC